MVFNQIDIIGECPEHVDLKKKEEHCKKSTVIKGFKITNEIVLCLVFFEFSGFY